MKNERIKVSALVIVISCCLLLTIFLSLKGIASSAEGNQQTIERISKSPTAQSGSMSMRSFFNIVKNRQNDSISDFNALRKRIAALRQSKDLYGLVNLADEIEQYWSKKDILRYANLMIDICGAFDSQDFGDPQQYIFARKYAKQALDKADQMPVELELELVPHLAGDIEYAINKVSPESWNQDRNERAKYWCHTWKRLNAEYDKNFDFSKTPASDHSIPPDVRAQKQQAYFKQHILQISYPVFADQFKRYLVNAYSKQSSDISDLSQFLTQCVGDAKMRQAISSETKGKLAAKQ